jgi:predicted short-subunit dehydrogenase-like oxidoreductase (DUF2520 family)
VNRQVPNRKYTIVGDGKVARHMMCYFNFVGIEFNQWQRQQSLKQLQQAVAQSDVVLLLISDDAIEAFIQQYSFLQDKTLVHFSGVLTLENAFGCHPLMTFSQELYDLKTYQSMPFVCDKSVDFESLFPQLNNKSFSLEAEQKVYYHAMCVMAGNFSQILMRETSKQLNNQFELPLDLMFPYLLQNTKTFITNPENSATGPLERGDFATINKHLKALKGDKLERIYSSFVKLNSHRLVDLSLPKHGLKSTTQRLRKAQ